MIIMNDLYFLYEKQEYENLVIYLFCIAQLLMASGTRLS